MKPSNAHAKQHNATTNPPVCCVCGAPARGQIRRRYPLCQNCFDHEAACGCCQHITDHQLGLCARHAKVAYQQAQKRTKSAHKRAID